MSLNTGSIKPFSLSLEVHEVSMRGNKIKGLGLGPQEMAPLVGKEMFREEFTDVEKTVDPRP